MFRTSSGERTTISSDLFPEELPLLYSVFTTYEHQRTFGLTFDLCVDRMCVCCSVTSAMCHFCKLVKAMRECCESQRFEAEESHNQKVSDNYYLGDTWSCCTTLCKAK